MKYIKYNLFNFFRILDPFETSKYMFVKVFPQEYQRALLELAEEEAKEKKSAAALVRQLTSQMSVDCKYRV
jgi:hypothetical protein